MTPTVSDTCGDDAPYSSHKQYGSAIYHVSDVLVKFFHSGILFIFFILTSRMRN